MVTLCTKYAVSLICRIYKAEVLYAMEQYQEAYQLINSCTLMRDVDQLLMLKGRILQAIHLNASSEQAFLKVNPNFCTHHESCL